VERFYAEGAAFPHLAAMRRSAAALAAAGDRAVRVLEAGGERDPDANGAPVSCRHRTEYLFTDVSPPLPRLGPPAIRGVPFVDHQLFDLEGEPQGQVSRRLFDLILASNVLHATADLRQTSPTCAAADLGLLMFMELVSATCPSAASPSGCSKGLVAGERPRSATGAPLLDRSQWMRLAEAGSTASTP
jgi:hypothetical protein